MYVPSVTPGLLAALGSCVSDPDTPGALRWRSTTLWLGVSDAGTTWALGLSPATRATITPDALAELQAATSANPDGSYQVPLAGAVVTRVLSLAFGAALPEAPPPPPPP